MGISMGTASTKEKMKRHTFGLEALKSIANLTNDFIDRPVFSAEDARLRARRIAEHDGATFGDVLDMVVVHLANRGVSANGNKLPINEAYKVLIVPRYK